MTNQINGEKAWHASNFLKLNLGNLLRCTAVSKTIESGNFNISGRHQDTFSRHVRKTRSSKIRHSPDLQSPIASRPARGVNPVPR